MLDLYCERVHNLSVGVTPLLAEPVNTISNIAFFIAAYLSYKLVKSYNGDTVGPLILTTLLVIVGIGSSLYHIFHTTLTEYGDVIPIFVFQLVFLWLYARKVMKLSIKVSSLLPAMLLLANLVVQNAPPLLNGSILYLPAITTLLILAVYHYVTKQKDPHVLFLITAIFLVSLVFRSIDMLVCDYIWIGTHFIWHILNSAVLYLCVRVIVRSTMQPKTP